MTTQKNSKFLELVNLYPSPHNGQPMRLKQISESKFDIYFEKQRGLQSTEISYIFSFVSIGIFKEYLEQAANALGYGITIDLKLPKVQELKGEGILFCGHVTLLASEKSIDGKLKDALEFRQTSRKKYTSGLPDSVYKQLESLVPNNMQLHKLSTQKAHQAIWLNQRAVFDDMFHEPVRKELDHWLRYSKEEKQQKKDGLAYDCMQLNGTLMKFIINHPGFLRVPVLNLLIKQYYLRTMKDKSDVCYMMAPFDDEEDACLVGEVIMKIWILISMHGLYLHPFGTIMSNEDAHRDFIALTGEIDESKDKNYLVFIFRAGKSEPPVRSMRLPVENHLLIGGNNNV